MTVGGKFYIKFVLINGKNGLFVSLPKHKEGEKYWDDVFVTDPTDRKELNETIIEAYKAMVKTAPAQQKQNEDDIPF